MRPVSDFSELASATDGFLDAQAQATSTALGQAGTGALNELRAQIRSAGMGTKLANTWRMRQYPGRPSVDGSVYIWSKAPVIIDAFDRGVSILPTDGRAMLAIPTRRVPLKGRGVRMTPLDVEVAFNQDLILRKLPNGHVLAFVDTAFARWSVRKVHAVGPRQVGKRPKPKLVLMFTMVKSVRLPKTLSVEPVADKWSDELPALIDSNWRA